MLIRGSERILSKLSSVKCFKGTHLQVMPDRHMHEDGKNTSDTLVSSWWTSWVDVRCDGGGARRGENPEGEIR